MEKKIYTSSVVFCVFLRYCNNTVIVHHLSLTKNEDNFMAKYGTDVCCWVSSIYEVIVGRTYKNTYQTSTIVEMYENRI